MKLRGIKARWMLNGIAVVLAVVVVGVFAFSVAISNYYYAAVRAGLEAKGKTASEFFTTYVSKTYADFYSSAYRYTESFEDKDKLELQFINTKGFVEISSYGITAGTRPGSPDVEAAIEQGVISVWNGRRNETGERIMAVSSPLLSLDGQVVGIMRYITSLTLVDRQVTRVTLIACAVGLTILLIVVFSNLYFIRTITEPIRELTLTARQISEGSYGIQAEKKFDDEIGDLIDTINEMSIKIKQSETVQAEFITSVSHELRTPLTAITGWSETLLYDDGIQGDSKRGISIIAKEGARLTKMVEELLEFTRIQDGRFYLTVEQIDVEAELEDTIYAFRESLPQGETELTYVSSDAEIPMIPGDAERLRQVFLNILDNAAKYGREGKRIIVTIALEEGYVVITFRDFGPGVPPEKLPRIKEKFYKGSSKERGSGIGLAVCEEIISRHNGKLLLDNVQDGGFLVTIKLKTKG